MSEPILSVEGLTREFRVDDGAVLTAVDEVSFAIAPGETLGVVGESGCGKSTLARMVLKLLPATRGRITLEGRDVTQLSEREMRPLRRSIQAVFQDPMSSLNPRRQVAETIAEPLYPLGLDAGARRERVSEMLAAVGLPPDAGSRYPHAFSGGQRQRIAIARALAGRARLVVCDEATSALDVSVQAQVLNLLADLQRRFGLSLMFISHNLGAVRHVSDRVAVMYLGRVVEIASEVDLFDRPAHPYTRALLNAVPEPEPDGAPPSLLSGEIPSPLDRPEGCHFHTRCPRAEARCRSEVPLLTLRRDNHFVRCHFPD